MMEPNLSNILGSTLPLNHVLSQQQGKNRLLPLWLLCLLILMHGTPPSLLMSTCIMVSTLLSL